MLQFSSLKTPKKLRLWLLNDRHNIILISYVTVHTYRCYLGRGIARIIYHDEKFIRVKWKVNNFTRQKNFEELINDFTCNCGRRESDNELGNT